MALFVAASSALSPPAIVLRQLLSSCVDACGRGCAQIQAVEAKRAAGGAAAVASSLKIAGDAKSALTEADTAAQAAIVGALRSAWPGLHVVGEEDDEDSAADRSAEAGACESTRGGP